MLDHPSASRASLPTLTRISPTDRARATRAVCLRDLTTLMLGFGFFWTDLEDFGSTS
jgi:hypothetical protein